MGETRLYNIPMAGMYTWERLDCTHIYLRYPAKKPILKSLKQIFPQSICLFCCRKYVDRSCEYINRAQTHECGNRVGTEAAQFPEKEYINRIFVAV
jgi:hypothetical protein